MVQWKFDRMYKADAEKVYREITSLGEKVTPEQIVEYARDESTELHQIFEWDDAVAAEKYRLQQAMTIIRNIVIVDDRPTNEEPITTRAIVNTGERSHEYQTIQRAVSHEDEYKRLLNTALAELLAFKKKYAILSGDLEFIFREIDNLTG